MGPPAERAVLGALADASGDVRTEACRVLAEIGTEKSLPALEQLAGDANPLVRQAAAKARLSASRRK
jgi:HEAT repeat protein